MQMSAGRRTLFLAERGSGLWSRHVEVLSAPREGRDVASVQLLYGARNGGKTEEPGWACRQR